MPSTASRAGAAAPTPSAAELKPIHPAHVSTIKVPAYFASHALRATERLYEPDLQVDAIDASDVNPAQVCLTANGAGFSVYRRMTPAEARQLAVYLVECANALDNPAQRVIVDQGEDHGT